MVAVKRGWGLAGIITSRASAVNPNSLPTCNFWDCSFQHALVSHHKDVVGTTLPALHIDGRVQKLDMSADLTQA